MPSYTPTDTASKIVALLENAQQLSVGHQQRTLAADVVRACRILSESRAFPVDAVMFDALEKAIPGRMNGELSGMFHDLKQQVVSADMSLQNRSRQKKSGLPKS